MIKLVVLFFRVEKEKTMMKSEIDELHIQIENVSKNRVRKI